MILTSLLLSALLMALLFLAGFGIYTLVELLRRPANRMPRRSVTYRRDDESWRADQVVELFEQGRR